MARAEQSRQPVALLRFIIGVCLESLISDSIGYISHYCNLAIWTNEQRIYTGDNFSPFSPLLFPFPHLESSPCDRVTDSSSAGYSVFFFFFLSVTADTSFECLPLPQIGICVVISELLPPPLTCQSLLSILFRSLVVLVITTKTVAVAPAAAAAVFVLWSTTTMAAPAISALSNRPFAAVPVVVVMVVVVVVPV